MSLLSVLVAQWYRTVHNIDSHTQTLVQSMCVLDAITRDVAGAPFSNVSWKTDGSSVQWTEDEKIKGWSVSTRGIVRLEGGRHRAPRTYLVSNKALAMRFVVHHKEAQTVGLLVKADGIERYMPVYNGYY